MLCFCNAVFTEAQTRHLREGLVAVHAAGVCHGDLHGGVIMHACDGSGLRITDFSEAQLDAPPAHMEFEMKRFEFLLQRLTRD